LLLKKALINSPTYVPLPFDACLPVGRGKTNRTTLMKLGEEVEKSLKKPGIQICEARLLFFRVV